MSLWKFFNAVMIVHAAFALCYSRFGTASGQAYTGSQIGDAPSNFEHFIALLKSSTFTAQLF